MKKEFRPRLSEEEWNVVLEHRAKGVDNINHNTVLDQYLYERGIDKKDVVSVKHWQAANGEPRFSIVTRENYELQADDIIHKIKEFIHDRAPSYPKYKYTEGDHLLVINPADIHIGKYSSVKETGEAYDQTIAVSRVVEGVEGLIQKAKGFKVDKILFCIGNDILHVDNVYNKTTKGTPQDVDGKWWEHFEIALELYVRCVERLREIAPVDCVHSMSNHDYQSGFHLAHALKAWFRKDKSVTVDASARHRKYYVYGNNLIGLEHGDGAKMDHLPLIMAQDKPRDWADTNYRYWYLHHLHHKIKYKWRDAKDFIGVTVEYLRSPSSADSWHARKGYVGTPAAVEAFVHSKGRGQVARLTHFF